LTFGLLFAGVDALRRPGGSWSTVLALAGSSAVGTVLVRRQLASPAPLLPIDLLRRPVFALSIATSVCSFASAAMVFVAFPFYLHDVLGRSLAEVGLFLTPWPLAVAVAAPVSGRLSDRYPAGLLGGLGLLVQSLGLVLLILLPVAPSTVDVVWRLALCGLGFGLFQSPNAKTILTSAPPERSGGASGMQSTARLLGQAIGAAAVAVIFSMALEPPIAFALGIAAGLSALGCIMSFLRLLRYHPKTGTMVARCEGSHSNSGLGQYPGPGKTGAESMSSQTSRSTLEDRIDNLLVGAIDPHVHSGPSIAPRSLDHVELAREASRAGLAAVVTKDHDYSGAVAAALIAQHFPELTTKVYSGIVLNNVVGGINPWAVEHTAAMGGKIVWMPTLAAENHMRWENASGTTHPASTRKMRPAAVVPVLDSNNAIRDEVKEILDVVAKNDMTLASGHLHVSETWLVFEEAQKRGVRRLIFTHPEDIVDASLNDVQGIAAMGAAVEHSLCMFLEGTKFQTCAPEDLKKQIDAAGVDNTILCSDLGQWGNISPVEGLRRGIKLCMDLGYSDEDIRKMVSLNAARTLGLEATLPSRRSD
jgi:hypothetical protein